MNTQEHPPSDPATGPDRPLLPPYLQLLGPLIAAHVLQSIGGLVDALWIGRLLGLHGVAAASAFFPAFFVILSIIIGMSAAVSVLVGKAWGASDTAGLQRTAATALRVALGAGIAVAVLGGGFAGALMQMFGTPADVLPQATTYARTALLGMPLTFTLWTCIALSRGAGDAVAPMWAILVATVVGVAATPVLITGIAGTGPMGLRGAAISSLLAQAVALAVLLLRWRRGAHPLLRVVGGLLHSRPDRAIAARMFRIGVPAALQMLSMALAEMVLLGLVNRHGSTVTAAYGAATQLLTWIQFPAMCLGIAASILSAHVIGAGRPHRVPAVLWTGLVLNAVVTSTFAIAGHAIAPLALRMFLADAEALSIAIGFTRTVAWSVVLLGWSNVIVGTLRARGDVTIPTLLGLVAILGVELPAAMWLEPAHGVGGLWWAYPIGFGAMLLMQAGYCALGWPRAPRRLQRAPASPARTASTMCCGSAGRRR